MTASRLPRLQALRKETEQPNAGAKPLERAGTPILHVGFKNKSIEFGISVATHRGYLY